MSADFDAAYQMLLASLDDTVALLRRYSEHRWADWLAGDRIRIERGDRYAFDHLLSAFGGMGSLNDVVLQGTAGAQGFDDDARAVNDRLRELCETIWRNARHMQAELSRSQPGADH